MPGKLSYLQSANVAALATVPVIVGCALLGATGAKAATCTADPSNCDPYVVSLQQVGSVVVAAGSGEFDLSGLIRRTSGITITQPDANVFPTSPAVVLSTQPNSALVTDYMTPSQGLFPGPTSFGTGGRTIANSSSGPAVSNTNNPTPGTQLLGVPTGYTSGTVLAPSVNVWNNATLASLGVTPGTYVWTWGPAADQSFTLAAGVPPPSEIPLPATLPLFASGLGALGLLGWRRKRRSQAVA